MKELLAAITAVFLVVGVLGFASTANAVSSVTISTISPSTGPEAGGTTVTITGTGFTGTTDVVFGANPTAAFTVDSDTLITASTPAGTGTVDLMIVGSLGMAIAPGAFTYTAAPTVPDTILDLAATAGDTEVSLTWSAPGDGGSPITSYDVYYRDQSVGGLFTNFGNTPTTSATVTGLTNGVTYEFYVDATNTIGTSMPSNTPTATPVAATPTAPDAPTNLVVTPGDTELALTWDAPASDGGSPITDYRIQWNDGSGVQMSIIPTATSYTITGLTNGNSYDVAVEAINAAGMGPGVYGSGTPVAAATAPDAPTGVTATAGDGEVTINWTAPASDGGSPITSYTVAYYPTIAGGTQTASAGTSTSKTITGLTNGTEYSFYVWATNAVGSSAYSSTVTATPVAAPVYTYSVTLDPITTPVYDGQPLTASASGTTDSPASVKVVVVNSTTSTGFTGASGTGTVTFNNNVTYTAGANVFWAELQDAGTGAVLATSASQTVNIVQPTAPSAPVLSGTAGNASASLSWTVPADNGSPITGYTLVNTVTSASENLPASTTSLNLTGMTNGATYTFVVYAVNAVGSSAASNTVTLTPTAPPAPAPAPAPDPTPQTVTVTWNANGGTCDAATSTVPVNTTVSSPNCTAAAGYTANGWDRAVPFIATSNVTVTAQWTKKPVPGTLTVLSTDVRSNSIKFTYAYDDTTPVDTFVIVDANGDLACSSTQGTENANTCTADSAKPGTYYAFAKANGVEGPRTEVKSKKKHVGPADFIIPATSVANQGSMLVRVANAEPGCQVAYRLYNPGGIRKFTALRVVGEDGNSSARVQFGGWRGDWRLEVALTRCPTADSESFTESIRVRAN